MTLFTWQASCLFLTALYFLFTFRKQDHQILFKQMSKQHLFLGICCFLTILWSFQVGIVDGLEVHFLALTAVSLILGSHLALCAGLISLLINTLFINPEAIKYIGFISLCGVVLPITISSSIYYLSYLKLPKHFAIYIFVCAFFAGALSIIGKTLGFALLLYLSGEFDWQSLKDNLVILTPLLMFPEAMLNGMTMTIAVVYLPDWVRSFYDDVYLK